MSDDTDTQASWENHVKRLRTRSHRAGRLVFGDRVGLAVFLGAVLWCSALWRIGFFITDSLTVANALANVADGHLAIEQTPYSLTIGSQPGIVEVDGQVFGRNYGHVLLALPLVWVLEALSGVFDPRVLLVGGWSLCLVAFSAQLHRITDGRWNHTAGSGVALAVFAVNLAVATPLPEQLLALVGLQLSTILVAAVLASTLYRLLSRFHGTRTGVVAGAAVLVATPVGFWASIPKRHILTAAAAVIALFCFAVSREGTDRNHVVARALSYAALGLLTTVHPFEAFFLFAVLVPVDLLTAPTNSPRTVAAVGVVFALSLLPFLAINTLISGNPLRSPRLLSGYAGSLDVPNPTEGNSGGSSGGADGGSTGGADGGSSGGADGGSGDGADGGSAGGADGGSTGGESGGSGSEAGSEEGVGEAILDGVLAVLASITTLAGSLLAFAGSVAEYALSWVEQSLAVAGEVDRLYHVFIRSGQLPGTSLQTNFFEAVELTLLESFPLVAAFVWLPVSILQSVRESVEGAGIKTPARQTDVLAAGFAIVFTLVYLPRLPLHSQITLRYILPVMPLLLYGIVRLSAVNETITAVPRWLVGSYLTVVTVGGVGLIGFLTAIEPAIGEAMQLHALIGLATVAIAAAAIATRPLHRDSRIVAVGLAVPAGATTIFLLLSRIEYFSYQLPNTNTGTELYALDVVRMLADLLPIFFT